MMDMHLLFRYLYGSLNLDIQISIGITVVELFEFFLGYWGDNKHNDVSYKWISKIQVRVQDM
jgi:hypothetical protein